MGWVFSAARSIVAIVVSTDDGLIAAHQDITSPVTVLFESLFSVCDPKLVACCVVGKDSTVLEISADREIIDVWIFERWRDW